MVSSAKIARKTVIFRTDGGPSLGLGHLYRCLALAQMLEHSFRISFLVREAPDFFLARLVSRNYSFHKLGHEEDIFTLISNAQIVVLDGYDFSVTLMAALRSSGIKVAVIDDLHNRTIEADLVINHAPGARKNAYERIANSSADFALGLKYVLLRKEFLDAAQQKMRNTKSKNIFVCVGGADPKNITETFIRLICDNPAVERIEVVIGESYEHEESLQALISVLKNTRLNRSLSAEEMIVLMRSCSCAIVPASGILFEALAVGLVCLSFAYVDNQADIFNGFKSMNLIYPIEHLSQLNSALTEILTSGGNLAAMESPIDGLSGVRLLEKFQSLVS